MESKSSVNHGIPPDLNGHCLFGFGGATIPDQQRSKKSKVRLNDQLIPKPTDINMAEKMIKIATPKCHPYSSHISQFAMFPSFRSPDEPETGARAAPQPFLTPLTPNVTLLSKTKGSPYRHEVLETPMKTSKKAVMWTGEHGFMNHTKPLYGENQVFYPAPPMTNPELHDWDVSSSERSNMLKKLERTHWVTSYQMHHSGSGQANHLKIKDFKEKISDIPGMNSHTAPLRESSFPACIPSEPRGGCRSRRQGSTCSAAAAELSNLSPAPDRGVASATINRGITTKYNAAPDPNQKGHSQSKYSSGSTEARSAESSQEVLHKQQTESKRSVCVDRGRENGRFHLDEKPMQVFESQSSQEANAARIVGTEQPPDPYDRPCSQEEREVNREKRLIKLCVKDESSSKKEYFKAERNATGMSQSSVPKELAAIESRAKSSSRAASEQEMLPRPPALHGIHPVDRVGSVGRESTARCLLDLQNSFSKSNAHRNFNSSIPRAAVNLRDNVNTGKKHDFYGINCYYLHG